MTAVDEMASRLLPVEQIEVFYARNRRPADRHPVPEVGQRVLYRRDEWGDVEEVTVVEVQDLDDRTCPDLWHTVRYPLTGEVVFDAGVPRTAPVADPWPWLILRRGSGALAKTWESRVRGSPGWLPLTHRRRDMPLPSELHLRGLEPLTPLYVPGSMRRSSGDDPR